MNSNAWERSSSPQRETGRITLKRVTSFILLCLIGTAVASAQEGSAAVNEAQRCSALSRLNLEGTPGGPAVISSARLVNVPDSGLDGGPRMLGGLGGAAALSVSKVRQYCDITGYVAPQNKFDLRLPLMADWN